MTKTVEMKIGTLNVGSMTGKSREVADAMERRKINILCVQETRWKGEKAREIGGGYKLFYSGKCNQESRVNGVGIILDCGLKQTVLEVGRISDRIMWMKIEINREIVM